MRKHPSLGHVPPSISQFARDSSPYPYVVLFIHISLTSSTYRNMPHQQPTNDRALSMEPTKPRLWRRLRKLMKLCKEYRKERVDAKRRGNDGWVQADD
jgi:hypothetical protein